MKKEKQVRSYKRRTKSGKIVTVKAHTAKYEAAEALKEAAKKKGAGDELEKLKKKKPMEKPTEDEISEFEKLLDSFPDGLDERERKMRLKQFMKAKGKEGRQSEINETKWEIKEEKKARKVWKANEKFGKNLEKSYEKEHKKSEKPTKGKTTKKVRPVGSGTNGPEPKEKKSAEKSTKRTKAETSEPAFTAAEFKEWYRGTGSAADKKVAKALREQLGRAGYRKLEDEAIDGYSARGHLSMFKRVSGGSSSSAKTKSVDAPTKATSKAGYDKQGYKKRSVGTGTKTSAQLKKEYEDAVINERKSALASSRKENKDLYNKYNTSYREVSSFMSKSKRKWQWNRYRNAFESTRMPNGEGMRGIARMSLKDAIKKMQKSAKK